MRASSRLPFLFALIAATGCDGSNPVIGPHDVAASDVDLVSDRVAPDTSDVLDTSPLDASNTSDVTRADADDVSDRPTVDDVPHVPDLPDATDVPSLDVASPDSGVPADTTIAPPDSILDVATFDLGSSPEVSDATSPSDLGDADGSSDGPIDAPIDVAPTCAPGRDPCATDAGTVCVDLGVDPANCGACGFACTSPAHGVVLCRARACVVACEAGHHACGSTCANNDEVATCGSRCAPCPPPPNATATCAGGVCAFVCDPGYIAQGAACAPIVAPRLVAPLSTATVTSRAPTLRWSLPAGIAGAQGELCADRACATVLTTFAVTGTSWHPSANLSPGVFFWRLRSRIGGVVGAGTSPVWQFVVPARNTARDLSWGTTLDLNGDGYADLAVGAHSGSSDSGERVYVYPGGAAGLGSTPTTTLSGNRGSFGYSVASAGDVNGDGYGDLVVGAPYERGRAGRAYVYPGGPSGVSNTPLIVLYGHDDPSAEFGHAVSGLGDVNGDGYGDLAVAASDAGGFSGGFYFYLGSPAGPHNPSDASRLGSIGFYFGSSMAGAGDVNGDGYADLIVGAYGADGRRGRASVFLGSDAGLGADPAVVLTPPSSTDGYFGSSVAGAGDINGDGRTDVVVAANNSGRSYVYLGSDTGVSTTPATTIAAIDDSELQPWWVAGAGDVNGDGYGDVVTGWRHVNASRGVAYVHLGGATGASAAPAATLVGPDPVRSGFGSAVAGLGDVNGDGLSDIAVGAYFANDAFGQVYVYAGSSGGTDTTPMIVLAGPVAASTGFGWSVASADGPLGWSSAAFGRRSIGGGLFGGRRDLQASREGWPVFRLD